MARGGKGSRSGCIFGQLSVARGVKACLTLREGRAKRLAASEAGRHPLQVSPWLASTLRVASSAATRQSTCRVNEAGAGFSPLTTA